jgi:hypothetical protein
MVNLCTKHSTTWQAIVSSCEGLLDTIQREFKKVQVLRDLVFQFTGTEQGRQRQKRGIFNLVGYVAHSLFGMLDPESEIFYNQKITQLEEEQLKWLKLTREQIIVVQYTLRSVNKTLHDVSAHEGIVTGELYKLQQFVNEGNRKVENRHALSAFLFVLNDHAMRVRQAIEEVKDVYNTVMQACLQWKNGIVNPQVLSPVRLMEILLTSQDGFPRDLEVPVKLSEAYAHLLYDIVDVKVYFVQNKLLYVVEVPLVTNSVFHVLAVIASPVQWKGEEGAFTLIQPEKHFLLLDDAKGLYGSAEKTELQQCRRNQGKELICKQTVSLFSRHSSTDCDVVLLQPVQAIPSDCRRKIVEVKETLWIPLVDNTWLFEAPVPERLTVVCKGHNPTDVEDTNSGVLTFLSECTGHGINVMIKSFVVQSINNTGKPDHRPLSLPPDCCEGTVTVLPLGELKLNLPKGVVTHSEELHVAKHKVDNVKRIVDEQTGKATGTTGRSLSFSYMLGTMVVFVILCLLCCCCLCRCCRTCWLRIVRWWFDDKPCGTIVFRPKIVNSLSTTPDGRSRELAVRVMSGPHRPGESQEIRCSLPQRSLVPVGKR